MVTEELRAYVSGQRQAGMSETELKQTLLSAGWQASDVEAALGSSGTLASAAAMQPVSDEPKSEQLPAQPLPVVIASHPVPDVMAHVDNAATIPFAIPSEAAPRHAPRWIAWIAVGVGAAVLMGGGAWAYTYYYVQAPERILKQGFQNLANVNSFEYTLKGSIGISGTSFGSLVSPSDSTPGATSVLTFTATGSAATAQGTEEARGMGSAQLSYAQGSAEALKLGLETRSLGKVSYVQLTQAPNLGLFDLSALQNKWIKLDPVELASDFGSSLVALPEVGTGGFTPEQMQKLAMVVQNSQPLFVATRLPKEEVAGQRSFHYRVELVPEGIIRLLTQAAPVVLGREVSAEELASLGELVNKAKPGLAQAQIEIWVGSDDKLLRQISVRGAVDSTQGKSGSDFEFIFTLSKFNEPVQVEVPATALSLRELLTELMGPAASSLFGGMSEVDVAKLDADSDGDGLNASAEAYYGTDPAKADTDGDGYSDGDEVKNGYSPLGPGKLQLITPTTNQSPLEKARQQARDAKRVADIRQLQTALELYFGDKNTYPVAPAPIALGRPGTMVLNSTKAFTSSTTSNATTYFGSIPGNPIPGGLPYVYESVDGKTYKITFALEGSVGALSAGRQFATPSGIKSENEPGKTSGVPDGTGSISFSGELGLPLDWTGLYTNRVAYAQGSNSIPLPSDELRMQDIKKIQSGLEEFYLDQDRYPAGLNLVLGINNARVLIKSGFASSFASAGSGEQRLYMMIPENPNSGGAPYVYSVNASGSTYILSFKLDTDTVGLKVGYQCATPFGISWNANSACVLK